MYDNLGGKMTIPKSSTINIKKEIPNILKDQYKTGFQYYDLQIDDKKLVELNIKDAEKKGATIIENRKVIEVKRNKDAWDIILDDNTLLKTKILINAAGPWINDILTKVIKLDKKINSTCKREVILSLKSLYKQKEPSLCKMKIIE